MRISVEGLPAAGRQVAFTSKDSWAAEAAQYSLDRPVDQLQGTLTLNLVSKRSGLVRVEGEVQASQSASCDRCGEPCDLALSEAFTLLYGPEEAGGEAFDGGEIELVVDDLDLGWHRGGEIDLGDVLREALTLSLPARVLCANRVECDRRTDELLAGTKASAGHPAFAALSGLEVDSDETG